MSSAEIIANLIQEANSPYLKITDVPASQQTDMAGIRALSLEMKDSISRNIAVRSASARSAAECTTI